MSEVIKNNEVTENTEVELDTEIDLYEEESGTGLFGKILKGLLGVAIVGTSAYVVTHRKELKEKKTEKAITKLQKDGYVVYKADDVEVVEVEENGDVEETEE